MKLSTLTDYIQKGAETTTGVLNALNGRKTTATTPAATAAPASTAAAFNWKPWAIGGGIVFALALVLVLFRGRSSN